MAEDAPEAVDQDEPELSAAELKAALLESQRRERDANARAEAERVRLDALIRTASPANQSAPPKDQDRRPWLVTVVKNHIRRLSRSQRRRSHRED